MKTYTGASDRYSAYALLQLIVDNGNLEGMLNESRRKIIEFAKKTLTIGQNLETVGRSLVAPLSAATAGFSDFDDKMRRVAAVTGGRTGGDGGDPKRGGGNLQGTGGRNWKMKRRSLDAGTEEFLHILFMPSQAV